MRAHLLLNEAQANDTGVIRKYFQMDQKENENVLSEFRLFL